MITEPKAFTAIRLPQRFQYCRRAGKKQWLNGICFPISDNRWKVVWYDQDGNGQSRVTTENPPTIPLSNGPHWLHRWIDNDYGWCNENTTDMRCCGQLFRDTDALRDHIFNNHNPTQQEPTMTFPETASPARDKDCEGPQPPSARDRQLHYEHELSVLAESLLPALITAGGVGQTLESSVQQSFTTAALFLRECERRVDSLCK